MNTELSRAKVNRVLPRESTGHSKHPLPTTQEKTIHGHHQMVNTEIKLITFFAAKEGEALMLLLLSSFSRVRPCATSEMAAHQAPTSLGLSRQEH